MSHLQHFPTVYPDLNNSPELILRGNPKLLSTDCRTIISVVGTNSIISHICQHAIKHAADYIRTHNLTVADYESFGVYLRERSVVAPSATKAASHDVPGRTAGGSKQAASSTRKRPVLRKDAPSGGR